MPRRLTIIVPSTPVVSAMRVKMIVPILDQEADAHEG